ncbi:hypothetical protein [Streptomyces sp. NRRL S-350]|uniref:hypothetical protein n=1 Tax=Streptomyces sp. NRRL S-350 TaxID=1463902 RepID=UPI0006925676|nr:hypothetical protein [Streptomyces sp. NRRL S-350]
MFYITRETKATLVSQTGGKVVGWFNDREARHVSIAVPGDRAKLTPDEARSLAGWLIDAAKEVEKAEGVERSILRTINTAERVSRW